jgi:hypothetical protein
MRPKKRILLIDPVEIRQSVTRLVLDSQGYAVLSASSLVAAREFTDYDLLLGYAPIDEKIFAAMSHEPRRPAIFIAPNETGVENVADATLYGLVPMRELLDRISIMAARKRGPRKEYVMTETVTVQPAAVAVA